ncbi:MAG: peptidoglycan editing factor PgeF [bacterium]|nr:peptidoglycan editing factor PgeF [bacterium]
MNYGNYPFYINFDRIPVFNFCTTRHGGISLWPFESCNTGFNTLDSPEFVKQNRLIVAEKTGIPVECFVFLRQVHGDKILYIEKGHCGNALKVPVLEGDGMLTDQPGICLSITLADCIGIAIYDPENHVAGICHSGWRGCLLNICGKLVDKLVERCGCKVGNLIISLSPSICYKCYSISREIAENFFEKYGNFVLENKQKYYLDLKGIVISQLFEKGAVSANIVDAGICTAENTHIFYSHRAEKNTGRFVFGIYLT